MTRSLSIVRSRRVIGAAAAVALASSAVALTATNASATAVSKSFAYNCDVWGGDTVPKGVAPIFKSQAIGVKVSTDIPASVYNGQAAPSRTVKVGLTFPDSLRAGAIFLGGVQASGSSKDSVITSTSNGKSQSVKIPSLAAPKATIPTATGPWLINASGTVPAIPTPASAKGSAVVTMPKVFTIVSTLYKADKTTQDIVFQCTGPSTRTLATVTIKANKIPTAANLKLATRKNKAGSVTLVGKDGDAKDKLKYAVGKAKHGKVTVKGNKATYTPAKNYTGKDAFTYTVSDGKADPVKATVSVTVSK